MDFICGYVPSGLYVQMLPQEIIHCIIRQGGTHLGFILGMGIIDHTQMFLEGGPSVILDTLLRDYQGGYPVPSRS